MAALSTRGTRPVPMVAGMVALGMADAVTRDTVVGAVPPTLATMPCFPSVVSRRCFLNSPTLSIRNFADAVLTLKETRLSEKVTKETETALGAVDATETGKGAGIGTAGGYLLYPLIFILSKFLSVAVCLAANLADLATSSPRTIAVTIISVIFVTSVIASISPSVGQASINLLVVLARAVVTRPSFCIYLDGVRRCMTLPAPRLRVQAPRTTARRGIRELVC